MGRVALTSSHIRQIEEVPALPTQSPKKYMGITDEEYKKGGYAKFNLKRDYIDEVHSRTAHEGKVVRGETGRNLLKKKLERQAYFERNRSK